jgi:protein-disulfide isomerase
LQELRQATHSDHIAEDVASADASGVAGTPGFFINGKRQDSGYDIATLTAGVRAARDRATPTGHM